MAILKDEIIYNKIKQCLINILGDIVIQKHVRSRIPGMIFNSGEFIITHES